MVLVAWLVVWLVTCLVCLVGWLVSSLVSCLVGCLIGCLVGCLVGCLFGCLWLPGRFPGSGWLPGLLLAWVLVWLVVWLVAWLLACLFGCLVGCLAACLLVWLPGWLPGWRSVAPRPAQPLPLLEVPRERIALGSRPQQGASWLVVLHFRVPLPDSKLSGAVAHSFLPLLIPVLLCIAGNRSRSNPHSCHTLPHLYRSMGMPLSSLRPWLPETV